MVLCCHKENPLDVDNPSVGPFDGARVEVFVQFNILPPDIGADTKGDRPEDWGKDPGEDSERKIDNLYLFAVDYDPLDGKEVVEEVVKVEGQSDGFNTSELIVEQEFELRAGIKRFYVGANMTEAHIQSFRAGLPMRADSYESALGMVMNNYQSKNGEGAFILMFSAPAEDAVGYIDIDLKSKRDISLTARLKRLVSKVMVVADYDAYKVNADGRSGETIHYIQSDNGFFFDFQFILNNTNRALAVSEEFVDIQDRFNVDPNWALSYMIEKDPTGLLRYRDDWDVNDNFTLWNDEEIKSRLESVADWWCSSVPSNAIEENYLGQGLYCLENTVCDDYCLAEGLSAEQKIEAAYLATTHVCIKARFAPVTINGESDHMVNETDERISQMYSQRDSYSGNPYTFYIHKTNNEFFTYAGATRWIDRGDATWADFDEYTGGWVYFKTFFEEGGKDDLDGKISFEGIEHWGIRRNDYCILTIDDIVNLGDPNPAGAYIKINSHTVPWVQRGSDEVIIKPKGNK